jgi:short-subunit dehydrogenase
MSRTEKGIAVVTGASTGIGAVYADRLARRGYDLVLVARDRARLDALAARISGETGVAAHVMPADLTDRADLAAVERRLAEDDRITMLVNNAGMAGGSPLADADPELLVRILQLNVRQLVVLTRAALPGFLARGTGSVVTLASVAALAPERLGAIYSGTKAFVLAFSQGLHAEVGARGVRVHAVLPGATRTEIWERAGADVDALPPEIVMGVDEMVDAALAGYDLGELVTIPALPDAAAWESFEAARAALGPDRSHAHAAPRYKTASRGQV